MTNPNPFAAQQLKAFKLAIAALKRERREKYAAGEHAYLQGVRDFTFAEDGHKHYVEYSEAIRQLEDFEEILTDEGVTIEPEPKQLFFGEVHP